MRDVNVLFPKKYLSDSTYFTILFLRALPEFFNHIALQLHS